MSLKIDKQPNAAELVLMRITQSTSASLILERPPPRRSSSYLTVKEVMVLVEPITTKK